MVLVILVMFRLGRAIVEWPLDGPQSLFVTLLLGEDTVYADGYSKRAFRRVSVGMTEAEVEEILGPPLGSWFAGESELGMERTARWTHSPGDTHYRIRVVIYRDGRVTEKVAEFYYD